MRWPSPNSACLPSSRGKIRPARRSSSRSRARKAPSRRPAVSLAGAKGLMQIMLSTQKRTPTPAGSLSSEAASTPTGAQRASARPSRRPLGRAARTPTSSPSPPITPAERGSEGVDRRAWRSPQGGCRSGRLGGAIPITETRDYVQQVIENVAGLPGSLRRDDEASSTKPSCGRRAADKRRLARRRFGARCGQPPGLNPA